MLGFYSRNRKHVPCFYRVIVKHEWTSGRARNAVSSSRVFLQLDRNTENVLSVHPGFRKQRDENKEAKLLSLIIKM